MQTARTLVGLALGAATHRDVTFLEQPSLGLLTDDKANTERVGLMCSLLHSCVAWYAPRLWRVGAS